MRWRLSASHCAWVYAPVGREDEPACSVRAERMDAASIMMPTSLRALSWWRGEEFSRVHVIRFTVYPSECDKRVTRRVRFECIYENV